MARRTRNFEVDRAGLAALLVSDGMRAAMTAAGQDVAAEAARRAPRRTGRLAGSYRVESATATVTTRRGGATRRASGRVISDSPYAAAVEFGHLAGRVKGHEGFRYVVPGAHVLGLMAGSRAARAATRGRKKR